MRGMRFQRRGRVRSKGCVCCGCIPIPLFIVASLATLALRRFRRGG